jgi:hypothetical protein
MLIPIEFINKARELGACDEALEWLEQEPRTIQEMVYHQLEWVVWGFRIPGFTELLSDRQFDHVRKLYPGTALRYCSARLSDEQFDKARKQYPGAALEFCSARLSDQQFDEARKLYPWVALAYCLERCHARGPL